MPGEVGRRFESLKWYAVRVRVHGSKDPDGWLVGEAMPQLGVPNMLSLSHGVAMIGGSRASFCRRVIIPTSFTRFRFQMPKDAEQACRHPGGEGL